MPLICYTPKKFSVSAMDTIAHANVIIAEYAKDGYDLTLRQMYYQFVSRGMIANHLKEYNKLGNIISDARLAGFIDWDSIVDRTRNMASNSHWGAPSGIIESSMHTYAIDKWNNQDHYVEVWVEKDALRGVVSRICGELDVPHFSCRGYTSMSEMWSASQRLLKKIDAGKEVHIVHLGDHDPSGIDMSRDIKGRLQLFTRGHVHVLRAALNMTQITMYAPPPNPAKITDSRFAGYQQQYGDESWELDALPPNVIADVVKRAVLKFRDQQKWDEACELEKHGKTTIRSILTYFPDVIKLLKTKRKEDISPVICTECGATQNDPKCLCNSEHSNLLLESAYEDRDQTEDLL